VSATGPGQHFSGQPDLRQGIWRQLRVTLLLNVVVPVVLYKLLQPHMSTLDALLIVAVVPALDSAFNLVRYRRLDAFGAFVLVGLLLGAAIVAVGGSPRFILARESLLIGAMGLALVASVAVLPRPLLWYLLEPFVAGKDFEGRVRFRADWEEHGAVRRSWRILTLVFGLGALLEAVINTFLAFAIPITIYLVVSQVVRYAIAVGLVLWLLVYVRRFKQARGRHPLKPE
jgi:intracellular septation protein A